MTARKPLTSRDPESIGGHRLIERLGEGGQGVVYLAEDEDGERVALKVLHDRGGSRDAFLKEISAARKVASFCTAEILHAGEDDGLPYVVTEFIDGPSLRELVEEKGPQAGPALYRLAIGTATALAAIHQAGIVHRDFKPGNVLVGPDGPRVIDFGVARFLDATVTASSTVIGTPSYMAPEQLAGETVTPAADVFAWGATIGYASNGRPPYGQDTIPAVMNRIVKGKPDLGGLTGPLRDLVAQALHKDAAKRPHSRDILLRLLEHSQGPMAAPDALAQGRALAMADDVTLTNDRTARWTTVEFPGELVGRRTFLRPLALIGIGAAGILFAVTAALAIRAGQDHGSRHSSTAPATAPSDVSAATRSPARGSAPSPASPASVAAAVKQAVAARRTAAFSAEGAVGQGDDSFVSHGRLEYKSEEVSNYDLIVRSREVSDPTSPYGPLRVVLFGKCAYLDDTPGSCRLPRSEQPELDDPHAWLAHEVRWVTSPYNIFALLRNSTSFERERGAATITYRGTARTGSLAKGLGKLFYEQYEPVRTELSYVLVTGADNLPRRLDMSIEVALDPRNTVRSIYSVTYKDWGRGSPVDPPRL